VIVVNAKLQLHVIVAAHGAKTIDQAMQKISILQTLLQLALTSRTLQDLD
jgi:hypothetical protein